MEALFAILSLGLAACLPVPTSAQNPIVAVNKGAASGVMQRINFHNTVHADCTSAGYPTVRIVTPPANGRLVIEPVMDYPQFPATNQRYPCNLKSVPGTAVSYLSNPGYVGPDTATVEALFPSAGTLWQRQYNISVR